MLNDLIKIMSYAVVFTTFNFVISALYYIYGLVLYRKKAENIQHSDLLVEQIVYLGKINFINVRYDWIKRFAVKIKKFSIAYFILSEIICFFAMLTTEKEILIGRISLLAAAILFVLWLLLLLYYRIKTAILAERHKENLNKALEKYKESKETEKEI